MSTTVISGRVDTLVARQAQVVLQREGLAPGDVIKAVWGRIASTGEVPLRQEEIEERRRQSEALGRLEHIRQSHPPCDWLASLTDEDTEDMIARHHA